MKKLYIIGSLVALGLAAVSCDDFLDNNRYPETSILNTPDYWNNASNVQLQCDRYIDEINPGYGSGNAQGWFYFKTLSDDQVGSSFTNFDYSTGVPSTNGSWSYTQVRGANYIIEGVSNSTLTVAQKANFLGIARFIRAVAYYKLCRTFGDCIWESNVVDPGDPDMMYAPRTSREVIMDSVFSDLNFALANINEESAKVNWSKDLIRAYTCEVALYEGTFCKYRTQADNGAAPDMTRSNKYLELSAEMAEALLGKYGFCDDYHSIYNSVWGGGESSVVPGAKIADFATNPEIIFGRRYDVTNGRHSTISYTASSTTTSGMSLDAFLCFLNIDGTPVPQASKADIIAATEGENVMFGEGDDAYAAYSIAKQLEKRDLRLSIITDPYVYYKGMEWSRAGCSGMNASSGFGVAKYDNVLLPVNSRGNTTQNYTSAPIYWTSYIACNYAEAKAELGKFGQAEFDKSLAHLYKRAGLPFTKVSDLEAITDPVNAKTMKVSNLLYEIRRCRRCELMFDNWIRYWDLIRWHQLDLLDSTKNPNVLRGAYIGNADKKPGTSVDDFVMPYPTFSREYQARYYLQPIPSNEIDIYTGEGYTLEQNPLWK